MTRENKDLLLKDLCARLTYGVKCSDNEGNIINVVGIHKDAIIIPYAGITQTIQIDSCKPYLFPLSSMTEEQRVEAFTLLNNCDYYTIDNTIKWLDNHPIKFFDWCDKNHFDYRGLIPKGLAIDCTNSNIY